MRLSAGTACRGALPFDAELAQMITHDEAHCRHIVRTHARTFWLASRFLPPAKRRAAFALYAFCRVADDLVDLGKGTAGLDVAGQLAAYHMRLEAALEGQPDDAVFRELAAATAQYRVPPTVLRELLDGVARDCAPAHYTTWDALSLYCEGVASSVGEMCAHVFGVADGVADRARAVRHARTLGVAMQLTNILRDVGEDARGGRCYLPDEDLARFGLSRADVFGAGLRGDARWSALMRFEIDRARTLYAQAMPGIALLAPDARRCAAACAIGYSGILGAIEANGFDTFRTRARLGTMARATVLWNAWRVPRAVTVRTGAARAPFPDEPRTRWA